MTKNDQVLAALAMDLKRLAAGRERGSKAMSERFRQEAAKRLQEINMEETDAYLKPVLKRCRRELKTDPDRLAEDMLMYSILIQNNVVQNREVGESK